MRTSELIGAAFDWAVATAEGKTWAVWRFKEQNDDGDLRYGSDWALAGPIIEREGIELSMPRLTTREKWCATRIEGSAVCEAHGPTPLIAAMRCFVASRLGDEVEIPEELK